MFRYIRFKVLSLVLFTPMFAWGQQQSAEPELCKGYPQACAIPDGRVPAPSFNQPPQYNQEQQERDQKLSKDIYEVTHPVVCTAHQNANGDVVTTCERGY